MKRLLLTISCFLGLVHAAMSAADKLVAVTVEAE